MKLKLKALAVMALLGAMIGTSTPSRAGDLFDLFDMFDLADQARARSLNVLADNVEIVRGGRPAVTMFDTGWVRRTTTCIAGADCSRRPVTAGNYLRVERGAMAPWLVISSYAGLVQTRTRMHEKGDITGMTVLDVDPKSIRPGGMHVRNFTMGGVSQTIRR